MVDKKSYKKFLALGLLTFSLTIMLGVYTMYYKSPHYQLDIDFSVSKTQEFKVQLPKLPPKIYYELTITSFTTPTNIVISFVNGNGWVIKKIPISVPSQGSKFKGWIVLSNAPFELRISSNEYAPVKGYIRIYYSKIEQTQLTSLVILQVLFCFLALGFLFIAIQRYVARKTSSSDEKGSLDNF